jgi:hypothetical protein
VSAEDAKALAVDLVSGAFRCERVIPHKSRSNCVYCRNELGPASAGPAPVRGKLGSGDARRTAARRRKPTHQEGTNTMNACYASTHDQYRTNAPEEELDLDQTLVILGLDPARVAPATDAEVKLVMVAAFGELPNRRANTRVTGSNVGRWIEVRSSRYPEDRRDRPSEITRPHAGC